MDRSETYRRRRANVGEGRISIIQAEGRPIRDSSVRWTSVYEEEAGRRLRGPPDPPSTRFLASRLASAPGKRQKISRGAPPAHCRPPKIYSNPLFSDARQLSLVRGTPRPLGMRGEAAPRESVKRRTIFSEYLLTRRVVVARPARLFVGSSSNLRVSSELRYRYIAYY